MGRDVDVDRRARRARAFVAAVAFAVAGCAGSSSTPPGGTVGAPTGPSAAPTTSTTTTPTTTTTTTGPTTVRADRVTLRFDVGGGCHDTAEPVGCGQSEPVEVEDADTRALLARRAAELAALPPADESVGCGAEFVDGVSVRVTIEVAVGSDVTDHVVCLSDAPADDPAVVVLWSLDPRSP